MSTKLCVAIRQMLAEADRDLSHPIIASRAQAASRNCKHALEIQLAAALTEAPQERDAVANMALHTLMMGAFAGAIDQLLWEARGEEPCVDLPGPGADASLHARMPAILRETAHVTRDFAARADAQQINEVAALAEHLSASCQSGADELELPRSLLRLYQLASMVGGALAAQQRRGACVAA
jgi:hypothetical protein